MSIPEYRRAHGLIHRRTDDEFEVRGLYVRTVTAVHVGTSDSGGGGLFMDDWSMTLCADTRTSDGRLVGEPRYMTSPFHTGLAWRKGHPYPAGGIWHRGEQIRKPTPPDAVYVVHSLLMDASVWFENGADVDEWVANGYVALEGERPIRNALKMVDGCRDSAELIQKFLNLPGEDAVYETQNDLSERYDL